MRIYSENVSDEEHWHYYIELDILLPKSLTMAEADQLVAAEVKKITPEKINEYARQILGGEFVELNTGELVEEKNS